MRSLANSGKFSSSPGVVKISCCILILIKTMVNTWNRTVCLSCRIFILFSNVDKQTKQINDFRYVQQCKQQTAKQKCHRKILEFKLFFMYPIMQPNDASNRMKSRFNRFIKWFNSIENSTQLFSRLSFMITMISAINWNWDQRAEWKIFVSFELHFKFQKLCSI